MARATVSYDLVNLPLLIYLCKWGFYSTLLNEATYR